MQGITNALRVPENAFARSKQTRDSEVNAFARGKRTLINAVSLRSLLEIFLWSSLEIFFGCSLEFAGDILQIFLFFAGDRE